MRVLLISTYELGHQPLHVASPASALLRAGHDVACVDLAVQQWDPAQLEGVEAVAISVPMHTAMRLALEVAATVRGLRPALPICLYGLYASTAHESVVPAVADRVIAGEYEPALVAWANGLAGGRVPTESGATQIVYLHRGRFALPARHLLPPLDRYARLLAGDEERLVGYVEASHGCGFHCRHCPVPAVYGGRLRVVDADSVLADIDQLVDAGARHITFGDPDFLNGVHHSRRIVAAMHRRHPGLTFDCTTKVELILRHRGLWGELAESGCLFVVSAFETTNDEILGILHKGHTRADLAESVSVLRRHGIEIRPSLMPFTPWTTMDDLVDLVDFVAEHRLIGNVDPVHYSIRLLLPEDSLLLGEPAMAPYLGRFVPEQLGYEWRPADPRTDELQRAIAQVVEEAAECGVSIVETFGRVRHLVRAAAGLADEEGPEPLDEEVAAQARGRPRLTEAWFCCAEPTDLQRRPLQRP